MLQLSYHLQNIVIPFNRAIKHHEKFCEHQMLDSLKIYKVHIFKLFEFQYYQNLPTTSVRLLPYSLKKFKTLKALFNVFKKLKKRCASAFSSLHASQYR